MIGGAEAEPVVGGEVVGPYQCLSDVSGMCLIAIEVLSAVGHVSRLV